MICGEFDVVLNFWYFSVWFKVKGFCLLFFVGDVMVEFGVFGLIVVIGFIFLEGWVKKNKI